MSKSPPLPEPITISLWKSGHSRAFERPSDILDWLDVQKRSWRDVKPRNPTLANIWTSQHGFASRTENVVKQIEKHLASTDIADLTDQKRREFDQNFQNLKQHLEKYSNGEVLSTEHPYFAYIQALAETDPEAGATLLTACLNNGNRHLGQAGTLDAIARIGPGHAYLDKAKRNTISSLKAELSKLRKRADEEIAELRGFIDQEVARSNEENDAYKAAVGERQTSWTNLTAKCEDEWKELKRVYDEKLALLAPTQYWKGRSKAHTIKAGVYAGVFTLALAVLAYAFITFGVPQLDETGPEPRSVTLVILPVLVPLLGGVWVLRILGRLLSENLMIAQDARERETMVMTFLALMNDNTTGKAVITDDDRKLILHALFRPSAVTASDDSPPFSLGEILKPKV